MLWYINGTDNKGKETHLLWTYHEETREPGENVIGGKLNPNQSINQSIVQSPSEREN